jgi:hypothetical protein
MGSDGKSMSERNAQPMTLGRRGRRDLAWALRHERGWTLERIGRRLGVKTAAVSRLLARATIAGPPLSAMKAAPRRIAVRRVRVMSLSSVFHA